MTNNLFARLVAALWLLWFGGSGLVLLGAIIFDETFFRTYEWEQRCQTIAQWAMASFTAAFIVAGTAMLFAGIINIALGPSKERQ